MDTVDAGRVDDYIVVVRRRIRPALSFQRNGTPTAGRGAGEYSIPLRTEPSTCRLTFMHQSRDTIISRLCKTRITPNQITIAGFIIGCTRDARIRTWPYRLGIIAAHHIGYRRWTRRKAVARQNRNDRAR